MQAEKFSSYLLERFGITLPPEAQLEGEKSLRIMNSELKEFKTSTPRGIPASRMKGKFPKPSTAFIQLFGHLATKNTIELERECALKYLGGGDLETTQEVPLRSDDSGPDKSGHRSKVSAETGYVILTHKKAVLGIGFYRDNQIENMLPKGRRIMPTQE